MENSDNVIGTWEKLKVVGKGGSSTVFKARLDKDGSIVAVKQIDTEGSKPDVILGIEREIDTMKNLDHPNILKYYGTQHSGNKIYIFLEYSSRGSLRQYYMKKGRFSEAQVAFCTRQIVLGLQYLHEHGIAHRDIKCANCLLFRGNTIKLADFGASKQIDSASIVSGLKGTPHWMAPEVIRGVHMTTGWMAADVWSLGCTIVEMLTGKIPYDVYDNPMTAMYHIASGQRPPIQGVEASPEIVAFINDCCNVDPLKRPEVQELLNHEFLLMHLDETAQFQAPSSGTAGSHLVGAGECELGSEIPTIPVDSMEKLEVINSRNSVDIATAEDNASANRSRTQSEASLIDDSNLETLAAGKGVAMRQIPKSNGNNSHIKLDIVSSIAGLDKEAGINSVEQEPTPLFQAIRGKSISSQLQKLQEHSPEKGTETYANTRVDSPAAMAVDAMISTAATIAASTTQSNGEDVNYSLMSPNMAEESVSPMIPPITMTTTPTGIAGMKHKQSKQKYGQSSLMRESAAATATTAAGVPEPIANPIIPNLHSMIIPDKSQHPTKFDEISHQHIPEKTIIQKIHDSQTKTSPRMQENTTRSDSVSKMPSMAVEGLSSFHTPNAHSAAETYKQRFSQPYHMKASKRKQVGHIAPLRRINRGTDQEKHNTESESSSGKSNGGKSIPVIVMHPTNSKNDTSTLLNPQPHAGHRLLLNNHQHHHHGRSNNTQPRSQSAGCGSAVGKLPPLMQLRVSNSNTGLSVGIDNAANAGGVGVMPATILSEPNARIIQSAPAVSRSVNLPPIGSQTPTYKSKKHPPTMMSLPETDRR